MPEGEGAWHFWLYICGSCVKSLAAYVNLKRICEENLSGRYHIQVIDLLQDPNAGRADRVVAIPTVVRKAPIPECRVIGDLSNAERLLNAFGLTAR